MTKKKKLFNDLPQTFTRYVEEVYDPRTGKLLAWRIPAIDLIPNRIRKIKPELKVVVTVDLPRGVGKP